MSATPTQKVVLVTGCSAGGIGFYLCEEFAARGCIVYATSRKLETMVGFRNENIRKHVLDVTNEDDIHKVVQTILAETGKIDVVVNNAGALAIGPLAEATTEQVRNAFELNTFAALRVSNVVIPSMVERKEGLIVNIGSIAGLITTPWNTLYCAAKAALHAITEGLAMECKPFGIKVMLVAPGGVTSNISKNQAATFKLSPTTMYKDYESKIVQRMNASENPGGMNTDEFARRVVTQALSAKPPPYMTLGNYSTLCAFYQWLPRQYVLGEIYKRLVG
ncbi:NAD(P)-binding protein [Gyrodon lividus]|nr:NAD(P)-binding protein [Gyrodon lividus]